MSKLQIIKNGPSINFSITCGSCKHYDENEDDYDATRLGIYNERRCKLADKNIGTYYDPEVPEWCPLQYNKFSETVLYQMQDLIEGIKIDEGQQY